MSYVITFAVGFIAGGCWLYHAMDRAGYIVSAMSLTKAGGTN